MKFDGTVKLLLGLIALFLGIIAIGPIFKVATEATAQVPTAIGHATSDGLVSIGSRVVDVSTIVTDGGKPIRAVYPMDNSQSFVVQYDDHFHVYRLLDVRVSPAVANATPLSSNVQLRIAN